jgi:hypothetical protein
VNYSLYPKTRVRRVKIPKEIVATIKPIKATFQSANFTHIQVCGLTQCPMSAMDSLPAVIPPPLACRKKVITSDQTNSRTMMRDFKKRQSSASNHEASRGRMTYELARKPHGDKRIH